MLTRQIGHFLVGIMFLTRLPVPSALNQTEGRLARAAVYFPLVGVLVGLIVGGIFVLSSQFLPSHLAGAIAIACGLIVTGALHEDGLADCCDGLGGGEPANACSRSCATAGSGHMVPVHCLPRFCCGS